ncbi:Cytochrome d ubiquinol oxidase, subunit II precursor [Bradyrhizobium sp. STM 3843]|uniref:cytochrome d ubiquinol oxidase subunit II n=1 Tax=Bradyrhizobium sp. STM 3843 TaxID=551947 RepID=UPI0002405016|nr:cytochrome d ubiquinol oxidase subunit II [Bradyrhizobium sp. STM 3843]CCE10549.1 Cytochrome d ubiquinol oxidase, subunit II precursor [Bradyrhizobium sp. STM 3843]
MLFWVAALAVSTLLYVVLDGFDLGVGILFAIAGDETDRRRMLSAISPVWDGNETWLVVSGTVLFGAFPRVYATLLSAFYLPIVLMLGALILRGVAFEFRHNTIRFRWIWNCSFVAGSLVATFVQGMMIGALVRGLPMTAGRYSGGMFGWLGGFACLCGVGLCFGYALLGAAWLVGKSQGMLRKRIYDLLPPLTFGVGCFLVVAFVYALTLDLRIMGRWLERPYLLLFPLIGAVAAYYLIKGIADRSDFQPFRMVAFIFLAAFATLAISFWPYMIPFSITVEQALAPESSLHFMFWGAGLLVLPLTLGYTAVVYWMFRGKIAEETEPAPAHVTFDYSSTYPEND